MLALCEQAAQTLGSRVRTAMTHQHPPRAHVQGVLIRSRQGSVQRLEIRAPGGGGKGICRSKLGPARTLGLRVMGVVLVVMLQLQLIKIPVKPENHIKFKLVQVTLYLEYLPTLVGSALVLFLLMV